jgi:hypothetical protein
VITKQHFTVLAVAAAITTLALLAFTAPTAAQYYGPPPIGGPIGAILDSIFGPLPPPPPPSDTGRRPATDAHPHRDRDTTRRRQGHLRAPAMTECVRTLQPISYH